MPDPGRGTVIFDLDGTLVDSVPDLAGALDRLMADHALAPFGPGGTRALIGHGIPALVAGAFRARGVLPPGPVLAGAIDRFSDLYAARLTDGTRPYPGTEAALAALRDAGWRLVVCTNKREALACAILADLGLLSFFALVAGPDTFGVAKPDPAHLRLALPDEGRDGAPAMMVGDTAVDVAAARAAGLPVLAVGWGYAHGPAGALGADALAARFDEVPGLVERLAAAPRPA